MRPLPPPEARAEFRRLHGHLLELLGELSPEHWERPVPGSDWTVRQVVAHLLDGDLRRLSLHRDGLEPPAPEAPIRGYGDLVEFLDGLNREWLRAARRLSPRVLAELVEWAGGRVVDFFDSLDPEAESLFPVAWAGEERSRVRMDVARELTEKWIHQQQIRDAVGRPGPADGGGLLHAVLEILLRGVPHSYRGWSFEEGEAPPGTAVRLEVEGEGGGEWTVGKDGEGAWHLYRGGAEEPASRITLDADTAWRLLATRRRKGELAERVRIEGDRELARPFLETVSVMA